MYFYMFSFDSVAFYALYVDQIPLVKGGEKHEEVNPNSSLPRLLPY